MGINDVDAAEVIQNKAFGANDFNKAFEENMTADVIQPTVDAEDMGHIMSLLSSFYSRPQSAAFREYMSNAIDANISASLSAGKKVNPVEVSLPENENGTLLIRDYGSGLDYDGLVRSFVKYGSSNKRDDVNTTGGFGLGSKSALAFAKEFNIISTHRNSDGVNVTHFAVMRPSGMEIKGVKEGVFENTGTIIEINANGFQWGDDLIRILSTHIFSGVPTGTIVYRHGNEAELKPYNGLEDITLGEGWDITEIPGGKIIPLKKLDTFMQRTPVNIHFFISGIYYPVQISELPSDIRSIVTGGNHAAHADPLNIWNRVAISLPPGVVSMPAARDEIQFSDRTNNIVKIVAEYVNNLDPAIMVANMLEAGKTAAENAHAGNLMNYLYNETENIHALRNGTNINRYHSEVILPAIEFYDNAPLLTTAKRNNRYAVNTLNTSKAFGWKEVYVLYYSDNCRVKKLSDKIAQNRVHGVGDLQRRGFKFDNFFDIEEVYGNSYSILLVHENQLTDVAKNDFPAERIKSFDALMDEVFEINKRIKASLKSKTNQKIQGKISLVRLGSGEKDVNQMSVNEMADYNVIGWVLGSETSYRYENYKHLTAETFTLGAFLGYSTNNSIRINLTSALKCEKDSEKKEDGFPHILKIRSNVNVEKFLDDLGMPDLPHMEDVYAEKLDELSESVEKTMKAIQANPKGVVLSNFIIGLKSTFATNAVKNLPTEAILSSVDIKVQDTKRVIEARKGSGYLLNCEEIYEALAQYGNIQEEIEMNEDLVSGVGNEYLQTVVLDGALAEVHNSRLVKNIEAYPVTLQDISTYNSRQESTVGKKLTVMLMNALQLDMLENL